MPEACAPKEVLVFLIFAGEAIVLFCLFAKVASVLFLLLASEADILLGVLMGAQGERELEERGEVSE